MKEKEFETYWKENRRHILNDNAEYRKAEEDLKLHSGADWLLFAIPVVVGVVVMNSIHIDGEILKWIASAVATIISFVVCVWVKSAISEVRTPDEIEREIKAKKRAELCN